MNNKNANICEINKDQEALLQWIASGLTINGVRSLYGDAGYLLNNMIAKYSLAANEYLLSKLAEKALIKKGYDLSKTYTRSSLYGKNSIFIYEHAVPANIVRDKLLESSQEISSVMQTLTMAGPVAMILRDEDNLLKEAGLSGKMPNGWVWGDDPLARYNAVGIEIAKSLLYVKGAIRR